MGMKGPSWATHTSSPDRVDHDFEDTYPGSDIAECKRCGLIWHQDAYNIPCGTRTVDRFYDREGNKGWRGCCERA